MTLTSSNLPIELSIKPQPQLAAVKSVVQAPSQDNPQALSYPESHSLSKAKILLIKNMEFIVH